MIEDVIDVVPIRLGKVGGQGLGTEVGDGFVDRPWLNGSVGIHTPRKIHSVGHAEAGGAIEQRRLQIADGEIVGDSLAVCVGRLLGQRRQGAT